MPNAARNTAGGPAPMFEEHVRAAGEVDVHVDDAVVDQQEEAGKEVRRVDVARQFLRECPEPEQT
jgi:hypothetical protein